jgi:hypothetical protein
MRYGPFAAMEPTFCGKGEPGIGVSAPSALAEYPTITFGSPFPGSLAT